MLTIRFPVNGEIESPKKQMDRGISVEDVLCRDGLELVIRVNDFAACVSAERIQKAWILFVAIKFTDLEKENNPVTVSETEMQIVLAASMSIVNFYITDDIVLIKYFDESDFSGEQRVLVKSVIINRDIC